MSNIKVVFGAGSFPHGTWAEAKNRDEGLETLLKAGVTTLDTARLYPGSEEAIGTHATRTSFAIDSKLKGGFEPGSISSADKILADVQDTLAKLKIDQLDILYIHAPDTSADLSETLSAIDAAHKKGYFKRFGLSNFTPQQVQEVYDLASEKGYVKPTVYQGNYSPIARHLETILFPTLRKLGLAFYAYSPLAGGFLTKTPADLDAGAGRFNDVAVGGMYKRLYDKPALRAALSEWNAVAEAEGVSKAELAYRWVGYNSLLKPELGDAVIFGASSLKQVGETPEWLKKGALSAGAVERIGKIWESVKAEAPVDNYGANKI